MDRFHALKKRSFRFKNHKEKIKKRDDLIKKGLSFVNKTMSCLNLLRLTTVFKTKSYIFWVENP